MGARQSKRSVDITTTPKKGDGEVLAEGEGKVEKLAEPDSKVTTNGAVHSEIEYADKDETVKVESEKGEIKENGITEPEETKVGDAEATDATTPSNETEKVPQENDVDKIEETPEGKKTKEKSKKKKWSFRSISFSKKDKSKPSKDSEKNGDVKEVNEENVEETPAAPAEAPTIKTEEKETTAVTNGETVPEESAKAVEESSPVTTAEVVEEKKVVEETKVVEEAKGPEEKKVVEEPVKVPEPVSEPPAESTPSPVKEDAKPSIETAAETTPVVECPVIGDTKEVRNEEVPPPLPSSNPPSPVTVFAESTKADALLTDQVPIIDDSSLSSVSAPVVETSADSAVSNSPIEPTPETVLPPNVSNDEVETVAQCTESLPESSDVPSSECQSLPEPVVDVLTAPSEQPSEPVVSSVTTVPTECTPVSPTCSQNAAQSPPTEDVTSANLKTDDSSDPSINAPLETQAPINTSVTPEPVADPLPACTESESTISQPAQTESQILNQETDANAVDSLFNVSTESLPSLPEPISESLPEPMSLPTVDSFPEPIVTDDLPASPASEQVSATAVSEIPLPSETVISNGNTNGLPTPVDSDVSPQLIEGPVKQVPSEIPESKCEISTAEVVENPVATQITAEE